MARTSFAMLVFLGAALTSAALVPLTRLLARRFGVLDHPGDRKLHELAMPRLGGAAVFVSFVVVAFGGYWLSPALRSLPAARDLFGPALEMLREAHRVEDKLLGIVVGSCLVFLVGLVDDFLGPRFPPLLKATGQVLAAVIVVAAGIRTSFLPMEALNILVTLLWIVGMTNAFNLLDNMDGLSAGVAFVACSVLLLNAWSSGEFFISLILVAFMGSLLGFLLFNFSLFNSSPASVFLGDCGSLFIGFVMASLTLLERYVTRASSSYFPVLMPVVVLAVPLVDTLTVMVIRTRQGRPFYIGDNNHLSHRLVALGFSRRSAVLFIYLATFCLGIGASLLRDASLSESLLLLLQSAGFVCLVLLLMFVRRRQ